MQAPYNFVPLSKEVYFPDWTGQVSQDLPFSDGLCGSISFNLKNHTPLLVSGETQPGSNCKTFAKLPDGTLAIPGNSLRGMIRAVVEIAGFGKFRRVDDKAMSVRDLAGPMQKVYGEKMTTPHGNNTYEPNSKAGWLRFHEGTWKLQPCTHLRVEYAKLDELSGLNWSGTRVDRKTAGEKYGLWPTTIGLDVHYIPKDTNGEGKPIAVDHPHSENKRLRYIKADRLLRPDAPPAGYGKRFRGRLVFTGHPTSKKHMDFVFSPPSEQGRQIEVSNELVRDFLQIHGETDEWKKLWRPKVNKGEWVPVFYLSPDKDPLPTAMGLSQMFKLAYTHGILDAIEATSKNHLEENRPDLAEIMFGDAPAGEAEGTRSRVSFSPARLTGNPEFLPEQTVILNGPKPSFFPNYIQQTTQAEKAGRLPHNGTYTTLMSKVAPQLRGWKRYPARALEKVQPSLQQANSRLASRLVPLKKDAVFSGRVRIHNLRGAEFGALLWAMTWGQTAGCAHGLGMGKPLGYGQVTFENIDLSGLRHNDGRKVGDAAHYVECFKSCMNSAVPNWENSEQLKELLAMANPANAAGVDLAHYSAAPKDFATAKSKGLVLKRYTDLISKPQ